MKLISADNALSWTHAGKGVEIALPGLVSSIVDAVRQRVLAVACDSQLGDQLYAFDYAGKELFRVCSPSEGKIYYVTTSATHGAVVVLRLKNEIGGWPDWNYAIGDNGELSRVSPAH